MPKTPIRTLLLVVAATCLPVVAGCTDPDPERAPGSATPAGGPSTAGEGTTSSDGSEGARKKEGANDEGAASSKEARIKELEGLISKAEASVSQACGCGVEIGGEWTSFQHVDDMFRCHDTIDAIVAAAKSYCTTPEAKAEYCDAVKGYVITFTTERYEQPKHAQKTVTTYCTDMKYTNSDELKKLLAK